LLSCTTLRELTTVYHAFTSNVDMIDSSFCGAMRLASDCSCLSLAMRLSRFLCANPAYPHPLDLLGRPHGQCPDCPTGLLPLVPDLEAGKPACHRIVKFLAEPALSRRTLHSSWWREILLQEIWQVGGPGRQGAGKRALLPAPPTKPRRPRQSRGCQNELARNSSSVAASPRPLKPEKSAWAGAPPPLHPPLGRSPLASLGSRGCAADRGFAPFLRPAGRKPGKSAGRRKTRQTGRGAMGA
jgi:hypothetical protein